MKRHRIILAVFMAALAVIVGLLGVLLLTPTGLRWAFAQAQAFAPGELTVRHLEGRLAGPIDIEGLRYSDGDTLVAIDELSVNPRIADLLAATLHISALRAQGVVVRLPPPEEPAEPGPPPDLSPPLRIEVAEAQVTDVVVQRPQTEDLIIQAAALSGWITKRRLQLDNLEVQTSDLTVKTAGRLVPRPPYGMDLQVDWRVSPEDVPSLQGQGQLQGSLERLRVSQVVSGAAAASMQGTLYDLGEAPRWEAETEVESVNPRALNPQWPDMPISGVLRSQGEPSSFATEASLQTTAPEVGPLDVQLRAQYAGETIRIETLRLSRIDQPGRVEAQGQVALGPGFQPRRIEAQGTWRNLDWPLQATPVVHSEQGRFRVTGLPEDYRFSAKAAVTGPDIPTGQWQVSGRGDLRRVNLAAVEVAALDGTINASGELAWAPTLRWDATVSGSGVNPAGILEQWPGNIDFRLHSSGVFDGELQTQARVERLSGTLRGYPLQGEVELALDGQALSLPWLSLRSGEALVEASGRVAQRWDLTWSLRATDLDALLPDADGRLSATGKVSGPRETPHIVAEADGQGLATEGLRVEQIQAALDLDMANVRRSLLNIEARDMRYGDNAIDIVSIEGVGTPADHRIQARIEAPQGDLRIDLTAGYDEQRWQGALTEAALDTARLGEWQLNKPMDFQVAADSVNISASCWRAEEALVCIHGQWNREGRTQFSTAAKSLPASLFGLFLPPQIETKGTVDASVTATLLADRIEHASGLLTLNDSELVLPLHGEETALIGIPFGELTLTGGAEGVDARLNVTLSELGQLHVQARLPGYNRLAAPPGNQPLAGRASAHLANLSFIPTFLPTLEDTTGTFELEADLSGTLDEPRVAGQASLRNGSAMLIDQRVRLTDVDIVVESNGTSLLAWRGSATSGRGNLKLTGVTRLEDEQWPTELQLQGERFQVYGRPDLRLVASPDMEIGIRGRSISIAGEVTIPEARVEPQEARDRTQLVVPSEDVFIVNVESPNGPPEEPGAWATLLNLRVVLGDNVRFRGYGLTAQVSGRMLLTKEAEKILTATGNLSITSGEYRAYGQRLTIQEGNLIFAGSTLQNPAIELRAVRVVNGITAGIEAKGRLEEPVLTLFSEPEMEETYVLSYLILGRPPTQETTASEAELLISAASALGLSGGYVIARRLAQTLGIEETRLEENALVLGRSLGPDLYVSYGIALSEATNTLEIRYKLNEHWVLETETGGDSRADLLYTIER